MLDLSSGLSDGRDGVDNNLSDQAASQNGANKIVVYLIGWMGLGSQLAVCPI